VTWTDPQVGVVIGGFRLDAVLGQGGMGTVYRATQLRLNRPVALKVLPPTTHVRGKTRLERFLREAQIAAQLSHPNIVQVFDVGQEQGVFFMAMELVEGRNLRDIVVADGFLPEAHVCDIFLQGARALEAALEKNLIHRDIKPENIMIDAKGRVKVADFGLARDLASAARITAPGAIIGTPAFMSPEQGEGKDVDHRSDLYSLGASMYFALTALFPYNARNPAQIIHMHIHDPIPNPRTYNPTVSEACAALIHRLMAKKPEDRYQNVKDLIADLEPLVTVPKPGPADLKDFSSADTRALSGEDLPNSGEPFSLASPMTEGSPPHSETLEVPSDAFRVKREDPHRFILETADDFSEGPPPGQGTLAEVEARAFLRVPGLVRAHDLDSALLRVREDDSTRKIFLFSKTLVRVGRQGSVQDPEEGKVKIDIILRALPCRSKEQDPENYKKNLTLSRYHAAFRIEDNQVILLNRRKNQGLDVEGKVIPPGRSLRLPETSLVRFSKQAMLLAVRLLPSEDAGQLFRIRGDPPPKEEGILGVGAPSRIDAVRIERPANAMTHSYVILVKETGIGEGEEEGIRIRKTGKGTRLVYYRTGYYLAVSEEGPTVTVGGLTVTPGSVAPLAPGVEIRIGPVEITFDLPTEEDFKSL
jgi:serine/threonine protein kinase